MRNGLRIVNDSGTICNEIEIVWNVVKCYENISIIMKWFTAIFEKFYDDFERGSWRGVTDPDSKHWNNEKYKYQWEK